MQGKGIPVKEADIKKLDAMSGTNSHQGVIAITAVHEYASVDDIFKAAQEKNEAPFVIICDEIEDPHNLGAILRTAEAAGAHGVIIPKRRNAGLTFTVAKTACGAVEYVPVAKVASIPAVIDELKKKGLWIYGADMNGETWCETDFSGVRNRNRLRGQRSRPPCARKMRFYCFPAYVRAYSVFERIRCRRHSSVRGNTSAARA